MINNKYYNYKIHQHLPSCLSCFYPQFLLPCDELGSWKIFSNIVDELHLDYGCLKRT